MLNSINESKEFNVKSKFYNPVSFKDLKQKISNDKNYALTKYIKTQYKEKEKTIARKKISGMDD